MAYDLRFSKLECPRCGKLMTAGGAHMGHITTVVKRCIPCNIALAITLLEHDQRITISEAKSSIA